MLKGKILSIKNTENGFIVIVDKIEKLFPTMTAAEAWIIKIIDQGKDKKKVDLLIEDCRNFIKIPSNNI